MTQDKDPFDLARFVAAQADTYSAALSELRAGRKPGHWMWFVFPQFVGLGSSPTARTYAIASLDEARAYLDHPLLGARYRACLDALAGLATPDPVAVLGTVDAMKLRSSLTLFAAATADPPVDATLGRWFGGRGDDRTLALIGHHPA